MEETKHLAAIGRRYILAAAALWSLSGVVTKGIAMDAGSIAFYRSLFAGLSLVGIVPKGARVVRPVMIPLGVVFGAMIGMYLASVKATTAANAIFLQCTATFWVVPLALIFLRERPDRRSIAGISLASLGVVSIVGFSQGGLADESRGIALGLGSGVAYALVMVGMRGLRDLDPRWLSAWNNLAGAFTLGVWIVATGQSIALPGPGGLAILVGFGVIQMAIPYALFARGLRDVDAAEAGLLGLVEPVLNPIWVVLIHGEAPARATIAGGGLLLSGVAVRYWPTRRT